MSALSTFAGIVHVLEREVAFAELAGRIGALPGPRPTVALSGGSTPKAFFAWAVASKALSPETLARIEWHVSDERCVPLGSDDSNFGNAARLLLDPLGVPADRRFPWPTELPPREAASAYERFWRVAGRDHAYDLCVLGLGDDSHVASLWPGCPLLASDGGSRFAATEWPGRGWRLTLTPAGLSLCRQIVVLVNGAAKAPALRAVCRDTAEDLARHPGQVLRRMSSSVSWLADAEAAAGL
ncbi:MAG: 6-phosphogluconolactonase [Opitutia bacterium]|jgi:6-phosphogluconolactonase